MAVGICLHDRPELGAARRLGEDGVPPEELRALADEVLQLGQEITDSLPRALRDLEEPPR